MISNPFRPNPASDSDEALLLTSATPRTIPEVIADASARFGPQVAYQQKVGDEWDRVTYEGTWRRANDFAAGLIALGLQKGDRVVIICENGPEWAVAYYGLSMAGGVGVPLYTQLKEGEIEDLVRRADARFAVASSRVLERIGGNLSDVEKVIVVGSTETRSGRPPGFLRRGRAEHLPFEQVAERGTDESRAELASRRIEPDDLASIVFTSGTTGGMKGVMLTHKNLASNIESIRRTLQLDKRDRLVLVLPLHHAFPFIILLAAFAVGGELTFENDLLRVRDRMAETKPTIFFGVPALFDQMYRTIVRRAEAEGRLEMFERGLRMVDVAKRRTGVNLGRLVFREVHQLLGGNLRWMFSGGAALNPEVARSFIRMGLPLFQGWGMTEAAPVVTVQRWYPNRFRYTNYCEELIGSVGEPIPGVEVKLIDVPEKEIYVHLHGEGELVVRGPNVFAGYWRAPEETKAAMVGEWLRTGDLGRIGEDGNIWITGRSKYVIVLDSGEKVVPDELEERFSSSDLLQDICVIERHNRGKTQVGVVIYPSLEVASARLPDGEEPTEASVRKLVQDDLDAFAKELAPYKRVSELILTDTPLPKTALQKVARGQLAESHSFDIKRWQEGLLEQTAAVSEEPEVTTNGAEAKE